MCGLLGFNGKIDADPSKIRILMMENESRGSHSTGMFGKRLMRKAVSASKFITDLNFDHIATAKTVIGHTRYSTGTAKTKENAHPFMFKMGDEAKTRLIGAHNGWVVNEYEAEQKLEGFERAEVDSASVFKAMAHSNDIKMFSMFEGAMALSFILGNDLYLYRRDSRPLFIGQVRGGYYYSSLKPALEKIGIPNEKIFSLKPNTLVRFSEGVIVNCEGIINPRLKIGEYDSTGNWDRGVSSELMEELTGKKPLPVSTGVKDTTGVQKTIPATGITNTRTTTQAAGQPEASAPAKRYMTLEQAKTRLMKEKVFGTDILLPSSADLSTEKTTHSFVTRHINNNTAPSKGALLVDTVGLPFNREDHCEGSWIKEKSISKCVVLPLYAIETKGHEKNVQGIDINIKMKAWREHASQLFPISKDSAYYIVCFKSLRGVVFEVKKATAFEANFYIASSMVEKGDEPVRVDIYLMDTKIPGMLNRTVLQLHKGTTFSADVVVDLDRNQRLSSSLKHGNFDTYTGNEVLPTGVRSHPALRDMSAMYEKHSDEIFMKRSCFFTVHDEIAQTDKKKEVGKEEKTGEVKVLRIGLSQQEPSLDGDMDITESLGTLVRSLARTKTHIHNIEDKISKLCNIENTAEEIKEESIKLRVQVQALNKDLMRAIHIRQEVLRNESQLVS